MALTDKQQAFVRHYFVHMNATEAYRAAGYKTTTDQSTHSAASRLLGNVEVQAALEQLRIERTAAANITADEVLGYVAELYRENPADFYKWQDGQLILKDSSELTDAQMRTIQAIEQTTTETPTRDGTITRHTIKLRHYSRKDALDMAMRYKALYNDKLNVGSDADLKVTFKGLPKKPGAADAGDAT